jgi:hypothetical protein
VDVGEYERITLLNGDTVDPSIRNKRVEWKKADQEAHRKSLAFRNWIKYIDEGGYTYKSFARTSKNTLRWTSSTSTSGGSGKLLGGELLKKEDYSISIIQDARSHEPVAQVNIARFDKAERISETLSCRYTKTDEVSSDLEDILEN